MKNKWIKSIIIFISVISFILIVYPLVEFKFNGKLIKFSYSDDISFIEDVFCYDESYSYNEKRDISIYNIGFHKFGFFHVISFDYKNGNVCETEYQLEEAYIKNFLVNATIKYNSNNIDLAKLITGKTAIVSNTRYFGNDYINSIEYILDNKYEILYVFYVDNLLVIQVGLSDEGPKYIAYK